MSCLVAGSKPLPPLLARDLQELESDVINLLSACSERGRTVIITNAAKGWVQASGKRFTPGVVKYIKDNNVRVVSAQAEYAALCPSGDPADWKKKAFLREITGSSINIVSVGDSVFEREAAHFVGKQSRVDATKTVKFVDMPNIEQLRRQICTLTAQLDSIIGEEQSLDIELEL